MSRRKYSAIWLHFEEEDDHKAKCKYCKATIRFNTRSQSNLSRHLKSKHPLKPLYRTQKKSKKPMQQPLSKTFQCSSINPIEKVDRKVLKMIAKGHHSFRLVEEPEFRKLINFVSNCPGYVLPTWKVMLNNLDTCIDMQMFETTKQKLHSAVAVCLSVDEWSSAANMSYVAVTAHYIKSNSELTSQLCACAEFESKLSPEILSNFLHKTIVNFEIENKVAAIVSDNSSNILTAIGLGEWRGVACFAHSLNEVAEIICEQISEMIIRVKNIIECYNKSVNALKESQTSQEQTNMSLLKVNQDVPHKWSSTFQMLKTVCNEKCDIITALSCDHPEVLLDIDEWKTIEDTLAILEPFNEVIEEISDENNIIVSKALVLCNLLESFDFESLSTNKDISDLVLNLTDSIKCRFGSLENDELFAESIILDPRFKRKGFKNDSAYEQAFAVLTEKICNTSLPNDEAPKAAFYSNIADSKSIWKFFDLGFISRPDNNDAALELNKYISEEYLDRKKNPFVWWEERKNIYPRVYLHALRRLCIVATIIQ